ncbi:hypothetical protein BCU94_16590 [Shewanella sp. 10N.286.52.C2]|nr:hypothetical protein BCU94_16590 [Shewanella sp. 10N.286.52.C2]PMG40092.1 hypothetical protein BCU91_13940 [Shewanella sp. 10N.286.52.B9]
MLHKIVQANDIYNAVCIALSKINDHILLNELSNLVLVVIIYFSDGKGFERLIRNKLIQAKLILAQFIKHD